VERTGRELDGGGKDDPRGVKSVSVEEEKDDFEWCGGGKSDELYCEILGGREAWWWKDRCRTDDSKKLIVAAELAPVTVELGLGDRAG
jgi:hypothetical protein